MGNGIATKYNPLTQKFDYVRRIVDIFKDRSYQNNVKDKDLSAPPLVPAIGDRYIIGPSPTGEWNGHENQIAEYACNGEWIYAVPLEGWKTHVEDEGCEYIFETSTGWLPRHEFSVALDLLLIRG